MNAEELSRALEPTLLRPAAGIDEIDALCDLAADLSCAAVVVLSPWVRRARARLPRHVRVCAAVAYPFGAEPTRAKVAAVESAMRDGADDVEVVALIPALVAGELAAAADDLAAVVRAASPPTGGGAFVRAVLETCYLDATGTKRAAEAVARAGCDMAVTSTGAGPGGATTEAVELLRAALPAEVGVKAAGGISSLAGAVRLFEAGAMRLGTTSAGSIVDEARSGALARPGDRGAVR